MRTQKAKAVVTPINDKWIVTIERPGSTMRIGKSFNTQDEAVKYANTFLAEYRES